MRRFLTRDSEQTDYKQRRPQDLVHHFSQVSSRTILPHNACSSMSALVSDERHSFAVGFFKIFRHRIIRASGHNLPQEAQEALADAVIEVDGLLG